MPLDSGYKPHQNIPPLFKEIVQHHKELEEYLASPVLLFDRGVRLRKRTKELRRAAEQALRWNTDKGNKNV
jgi:hypothetical protein